MAADKLYLTWRSHFRRSLSLPLTQVSGRYCPLSEDSYRIPLPGAVHPTWSQACLKFSVEAVVEP